jgi:hypothetical protein
MANRPSTGGALHPSTIAALLSIALALAIGSAPIVTLLTLVHG